MRNNKIALTKEYVQDILKSTNNVLMDNKYVVDFLYKKYKTNNIFCMHMLPEQEYLYEILINGNLIIHLEFNTQSKDIILTSEISIENYLNEIDDEQEKVFLLFASEIAQQTI